MPSSKRGAGQSQIVNYWWLGTRAGYCASWVYNSASGRRCPLQSNRRFRIAIVASRLSRRPRRFRARIEYVG